MKITIPSVGRLAVLPTGRSVPETVAEYVIPFYAYAFIPNTFVPGPRGIVHGADAVKQPVVEIALKDGF